jgi:hypothetical protein
MPQPQQSTPFLQGDLTPLESDFVDLRNDNAGTKSQQAQSIVLRYLRSLPAQDSVTLETLRANVTRHYPFQNEPLEFFQSAVKTLQEEGWVKAEGDVVQLNKIAGVTRRFLARFLRASR